MSAALSQILTIFLAILAGFVCRKAKVLTEENTSALSNVVVKIILPFYLFGAILRTDAGVDPRAVPVAVGLSAAMFLLSALVDLAVVPLLRAPKEDRGVYLFELMCGNVTYIGIPVCAAVLGGSASFYASLLNIPYNLICFSLGIFLLCGKFSLRKALNPAFLAGLAAAILYMLRVQLPPVLLSGCAFLGQATSPCAMLVIGSVLASVPIREIVSEWRAIPFVLLRLVGIAALTALLLRFLPVDPTLKGVLILMAAMPAATNSTMLCTIYGGNRALSAKLIFLSTALSLVSIPLWAALYFG